VRPWRAEGSTADADLDGAAPAETLPSDTHWAEGARVAPGREPAEVGICVSGGGIRSACVTLGALDVLRDAGVLGTADYLVSVSGGGYAVGAMQLAMQSVERGGRPGATPADVHAPGSVEADHTRRHSKYIAEGTWQWAVALGVLLRGLLASLALIGLTLVVLGTAVATFYRLVPVLRAADLTELHHAIAHPDGHVPAFPAVMPSVWLAVGGALALAALVYLAYLVIRGTTDWSWGPRCLPWGGGLVVVALLLGVAGAGLPALMWLAAAAVSGLAGATGPTVAPYALGPVLLGYLGTLAGILWRRRTAVGTAATSARRFLSGRPKPGTPQQALPSGLVQQLIVFLALAVLVAGLLVVFGGTTVLATRWHGALLWAPTTVLLAAIALLDQTWLSLHPFYRRRLASAFAVRRGARDGRPVAVPYPWSEQTALSRYADKVEGFPRVIFAAAAELSGQDRTPPGRRAVSFTLSGDYVGGPQLGWLPTKALEGIVKPQLRRDLTVESAVAVSGAAFASAMGAQARAFQTFYALTGARLGTWLPNPAFLGERAHRPDDWTLPRLPRLRRLSYLLREVTGRFPCNDRMLLVTDGGHYENLGLVELLRHRVRTVYCIDASGDQPPMADTLGQAITLAREELGVRIELDDALDLVPGSAEPLDPRDPLAVLNGHLCRSAAISGTIHYPPELSLRDGSRTGRIVVAKATLTRDMDYDLLAYAVRNPSFPRDGTADQWFDHEQFNNYQALGRHIGKAAVDPARWRSAPLDGHPLNAGVGGHR
jgi:hypothetical protein